MIGTDDNGKFFDPSLITGKAFEKHFELQDALFEFSKLFKYEEKNDRAIAIVGAAFLDTLLEHILVNFLADDEKEVKKMLKYDQPLGTYGNRITMAYCLGLIGKIIRDDLRLVGRIRNRFAHDLYASFNDEKIQSWCKSLKWHRIAILIESPSEATARDLFQVGVNQIVAHLHGLVSVASLEKRSIRFSP
ncbi:MAG: hypothetical protein VKL41_07780 [Snowella sp.]|nr:hypothetical protein [Snowella sp.]